MNEHHNHWRIILLAVTLEVIAGLILTIVLSAKIQEIAPGFRKETVFEAGAAISTKDLKIYEENLRIRINKEHNKLLKKIPGGYYLVVNLSENRFFLCNSKGVIREGICSTGNLVKLVADDNRSWTFETPKGSHRVRDKIKNPVWKKPDWAFIEEGQPVPPPDDHTRFEYGVLGDYALSLGNGYLIHGTLYQRQLGMPVTHGCIRLADEDLEAVYNHLSIGSKVMIF